MSRNLLAILLSELKTVRLVCQRKGCGGVIEMTIAQLGNHNDYRCPVCNLELIGDESLPHKKLSEAIRQMEAHQSHVKLEFVLSDDSGV